VGTSTPDGFLNFAMKAFLGEMERRQVKHRTKKAMEYKKNQSAVVGSVPYGYKRNGNGLEENPQEQAVIKLINELYRQSARLMEICRVLKEKGIKTGKGSSFSSQQVKRIVDGYKNRYSKENGRLSKSIRQFIKAIA